MIPIQERVHDIVATAVKRANVQSGWVALGPAGDDILVIDQLPHD
jgi:hypothetical protein